MADGIIRFDEGWHLDAGWRLDQVINNPPVVPAPVLPTHQKGIKHMDFIPRKRGDRYLWFKNLRDSIETEGPKFALAAGEITATKDLAAAAVTAMEETNAAEAALDGKRAAEKTTAGASEKALRMKFRNWKSTPGFVGSESEGVLQLVGPASDFDPLTFKSVVKLSIVGEHIRVDFTKDECDNVVVYCRLRGSATWTRLGTDGRTPYYDTNPLANPAVPEVREYMVMGMIDNEEIGLPSDIVSIVFAG